MCITSCQGLIYETFMFIGLYNLRLLGIVIVFIVCGVILIIVMVMIDEIMAWAINYVRYLYNISRINECSIYIIQFLKNILKNKSYSLKLIFFYDINY